MMINKEFPISEISLIAEKESWRKEINRPIYHIHKWWAQRLGSVFRAILLHLAQDENAKTWESFYDIHDYTDLTILDPFMGSGTTVGEAIKLGMNAVGCDINPVSSFLVKQELTRIPYHVLLETYCMLEEKVAPQISDCYKTLDVESGKEIPVLYYFWVKIVTTPKGEEIPLFSRYVFAQNAYASKKPDAQIICPKCWRIFSGKYNQESATCPHCHNHFNPQVGPAKKSVVTAEDGTVYKIKDLIPNNKKPLKEKMYALLAVDASGSKKYQSIQEYDLALYKRVSNKLDRVAFFLPTYEVRPGYNTDQARGYNYFYWRDFFNSRQLYGLGLLLSEILKIENSEVREQFLCLFSSTLEFNNTFCSYKGEGTGAVRPIFSNHILKPERTPLENSIWGSDKSSGCFSSLFKSRLLKAKQYLDEPFELKINENSAQCTKVISSNPIDVRICSDWESFSTQKHAALILNGDSANLAIPSGTIDFVVTDPPYFDFIHYSELSDFFYAWLSPVLQDKYHYFTPITSGRPNEVQQTDADKFSVLLSGVFKESNRVLKESGKLVFSFHHSRTDGWIAIANAIKNSGFSVVDVFPIHAELMASTPKASAKEPISLDAIITCAKENVAFTNEAVLSEVLRYVDILKKINKSTSKSDLFVITASQCLKRCVNDQLSDYEMTMYIDDMYDVALKAILNSEIDSV